MRYLAIIAACLLAAGARGQLAFDGTTDQAANVPSFSAIEGAGKVTLCGWFRFSPLGANDVLIAQWYNGGQMTFSWQTHSVADELAFYINGGAGSYISTDANLSADVWYHLALVFDGALAAANRVKMFRDDVRVSAPASGAMPTTIPTGTVDLQLADLQNFANRELTGDLDIVRAYTTALTTNELASLILDQCDKFKPELATNTALTAIRDPAFNTDHSHTNCAASYDTKFLPFSDGAAVTGTWHDATGNGNDATVYNSPTREAAR